MAETLNAFRKTAQAQTIDPNHDHGQVSALSSPTRYKLLALTSKKLRSPLLNNIKQNLIDFQKKHSLQVQQSEKELLNLFPPQGEPNPLYTDNIPKITMILTED